MDTNTNNVQEVTEVQKPEDESLKLLLKVSKRQLWCSRISTICFAGIMIAMIYAVTTLVPRAVTTLDHINQVAQRAETSLDQIDDMSSSMIKASDSLNALVEENAPTLTESVKNIAEIDFQGLNEAIKDLQDAIGPLAAFMNRFR